MRAEARAVADLAGELGLWVAFGAPHPLTPPHRPHNSLYVVSDTGKLVGRYDKRYLSHTEVSYLYTPGTAPLVFEVRRR
ncbi:nitrilase-related carbon-nitrogen hydrolase [Streptomyces canus]|uniref:nitrilase-related carbon-nitrogen hydrolase n=1 Tax=Streptomyces canus TaxID=58343 RepID=UPI00277FA13D|nr:nitrilase-related carbon-nitrogen hydrolase [Streptomyces canus]MDQ1070073.1 putative amidohydrolase [Streptomyces canus]